MPAGRSVKYPLRGGGLAVVTVDCFGDPLVWLGCVADVRPVTDFAVVIDVLDRLRVPALLEGAFVVGIGELLTGVRLTASAAGGRRALSSVSAAATNAASSAIAAHRDAINAQPGT
jgi:hypothetical protein